VDRLVDQARQEGKISNHEKEEAFVCIGVSVLQCLAPGKRSVRY
jgi:hypothetical protein